MVELKKKKAKGKGLLYDAFFILPKSRQNYLAVCVCVCVCVCVIKLKEKEK